jgi:hypothetical protein
VSRQDRVVEMDGHVASPESSRNFYRSAAHLFGYSVIASKDRLNVPPSVLARADEMIE